MFRLDLSLRTSDSALPGFSDLVVRGHFMIVFRDPLRHEVGV